MFWMAYGPASAGSSTSCLAAYVVAIRGPCAHPNKRSGKKGGYAAFASHGSCIQGYQRDSVERHS